MPIISRLGGSGGGSATAKTSDILIGKTAWVNGKKITGIMPNNGAITKTLKASESISIPAGYHDGSGVISAAPETGYKYFSTSIGLTKGKVYTDGSVLCSTGLGSITPYFIALGMDNDSFEGNDGSGYGQILSKNYWVSQATQIVGGNDTMVYLEYQNGNIVLRTLVGNSSITGIRVRTRSNLSTIYANLDIFYK